MTKDVLFEIGLEELPARFIDSAEEQLLAKTKEWLKDLRISYESLTSFSTPRRLAVRINGMAEKQTTIEEEAKGPSIKIARDEDGNWTKAAIGFTKGQGKSVEDIYTKEIKGTTYIFVNKRIEGKASIELLPEFKGIIESIQFGKNMRWGNESLRYARPIRWLVALYGTEIVPFEIANVQTGNVTYGHRFLGEEIILQEPKQYVDKLKDNYVIVDAAIREEMIKENIERIAKQKNYIIPMDRDLLNEVRNLVEYPTVFVGTFEEEFLHLPSEVLVTSMKEHQRYFPVKSEDGNLLPYFVGVRNGDEHGIETVIKGNEKVLRARLSDGRFFYEEDQKQSINYYQAKLKNVVFQEKLGTISQKVERIKHISSKLASLINVDNNVKQNVERASEISKFDLMTNMVNEFTELQGVMGEKYAVNYGENGNVAQAIREQYLPNSANGELPKTVEGSIVSIADKLDTIVGCIFVGLRPTGSQDPYALRRQAVGILRILEANKWEVSINSLIRIAMEQFETEDMKSESFESAEAEVMEFMKQRAVFVLKELSIEGDIIEAVLKEDIGVLSYSIDKAELLSAKRSDASFKSTQEALVRMLNLAKKSNNVEIDPTLFETDSEKNLFEVFTTIKTDYEKANANKSAKEALNTLSKLADPIHVFFEHNMVMAKDEKLRNNRLALVKNISDMIYDFADLSSIEWKQQF